MSVENSPQDLQQNVFNTAVQHHLQGNLTAARHLYEQILQSQPNHADVLSSLGYLHFQLGDYQQAKNMINKAIFIDSSVANYFNNLGLVCQALHLDKEAQQLFEHALQLNPQLSEALNNLGNLHRARRNLHKALQMLETATLFKPTMAEAHCNLGCVLQDLRRYDEALISYEQALKYQPHYPEVYNNIGSLYFQQGLLEEAMAYFEKTRQLIPEHPELICNMATLYHEKRQFDLALETFQQAISLKPHYPEAHCYASLTNLLLGRFDIGWPQYEWRLSTLDYRGPDYKGERWDGKSDLKGTSLLIYAEQGFGDVIQFSRYVPLLQERYQPACITLIVAPNLKRLFQYSFPQFNILDTDEPWPEEPLQTLPMLSLPGIFNTHLETIPAPIPYLKVQSQWVAHWQTALPPLQGIKIGIVWASDSKRPHSLKRTCPLSHWLPLFDNPDTNFISLQVGPSSHQMATTPGAECIIKPQDCFTDFADTAAIIEDLDLIISVDTAVAHLAGALGKPVWLLLPAVPDWRWLLDREDTPWYPGMKLFRQPTIGDWDSVMAEVSSQLKQYRADRSNDSF